MSSQNRRHLFAWSFLLRMSIAGLLVAFVVACGSRGDAEPVEVAAAPCTSTVTVTIHGDSTVAGVVAVRKAGGFDYPIVPIPPAALLQIELDARFGAGKVVVVAAAAVGGTGQEAVDGRNAYPVPLASTKPADIDVFNFMLNDQAQYPVAQYHEVLESFAAFAPGAIFMTSAHRFIDPYQNEMRAVAREHGIPVAEVHRYFVAQPPPSLRALLPDGTHGTQDWYRAVSRDVLAPVVAAEVDRRLCH